MIVMTREEYERRYRARMHAVGVDPDTVATYPIEWEMVELADAEPEMDADDEMSNWDAD